MLSFGITRLMPSLSGGMHPARAAGCGFLVSIATAAPAMGMRLANRVYTTADGLPADAVSALATDTRGQILVGGDGVLSFFDGTSFRTADASDGLPPGPIQTILRTRAGTIWIGAQGAIARLDPNAARRFTVMYLASSPRRPLVFSLVEDPRGRVWVGTSDGIWRIDDPDGEARVTGPLATVATEVDQLALDQNGHLWAATAEGLTRLDLEGDPAPKRYVRGLPERHLTAVLVDRTGRIWAGTRTSGLCLVAIDPDRSGNSVCERLFTSRDGLVTDWIRALYESADGVLNVGTGGGLSRSIAPGAEGPGVQAFRALSAPQGVPIAAVDALVEDRDHNLWLGTEDAGLVKLVRGGLVSFGIADGLRARGIVSMFEDSSGALYVITSGVTRSRDLHRLDGERFTAVTPRVPASIDYLGWSAKQTSFRDRAGIWWIATGRGLCRYPRGISFEALASTLPEHVYTRADGLTGDDIFRLFEDRRGDVWIGTFGPGGLSVWRRRAERIENLTGGAGFPAVAPTSFVEDPDGVLWVGLYPGGLVRIADPAGDVRVERLGAAEGLIGTHVSQVLVDARGRLWVATGAGLACLEDTRRRLYKFRTWTRADGLAGDDVEGIAADTQGRIYLATSAGVTRMSPETGALRNYTTADGLPRAFTTLAYREARGDVWFGTRDGLARLTPEEDPAPFPPEALIRAVQVAGEPEPVSILGESSVKNLWLRSGQSRIRIEFGTVDFRAGESVSFEYRLDDRGAWSARTRDTSILFDGLPPGRHRFEVRAVSNEGVVSAAPATVSFGVEPPFWRRAWFLLACTLGIGCGLYLWHRSRAAHAVAIERVRTHIATDLHDDIGATLSQIAILNEVALARLGDPPERARPLLESAARSARELVDTMGDIVWSVDPRRDRVDEVVRRMRRAAEEICAAREIKLEFEAPDGQGRALEPATRRQIFLVFKESLSNCVRHSGCRTIRVALRVEARSIDLAVSDDGAGFDPEIARDGNGLASMRRRAQSIGGRLTVRSSPGRGAEIHFTAPL